MKHNSEDISPSSEWPSRRSGGGRWKNHSISGMDGPTSRLPSSSVASVSTANMVSQRSVKSVKESFKSAPATPSTSIDPPRPAREGCEWVWFPAGYWAEREIVETPGKIIRHFKWRKRSGKSSSGRDTQDDSERSPGYPRDWISRSPMPTPSPFLTEETHIQSLQRPPLNRHGTSSESGGSSFPLNQSPQAEMPSPYLTEEMHVLSLQRSPLGYQSSASGTSLPILTEPKQSTPLTVKGEDSDTPTPMTISVDQQTSTSGDSLATFLRRSPPSPGTKPKKSLLARLLPEHKPKLKKTHSDTEAQDYTTKTIEGAQAQLMYHCHHQSPVPMMSRVASLLRKESKKQRSSNGSSWSRSLKLFGKSPWHRKASAGSEASTSSSVRDVLRGRAPVTSPASDIGPLHTCSMQFPGGEAIRVKTPPLRESPHRAGRPRSFFFDISTPPDHSISSSSGSDLCPPYRSPSPIAETHNEGPENRAEPQEGDKKKKDSGKEWWEVPSALPRFEALAHGSFEFDMPEHLPTSPMCPANKRHKSGGTGVCVYHGRRKKSGTFKRTEQKSEDDDDDEREVWT
ncbi:hypothetical protein F5Y04DRAFT_12556 [Hypomontagnella monticulosa]|nr:hypothetical protein F5Y04DRAFT_12556 [Hypomontagnella monticulosa]